VSYVDDLRMGPPVSRCQTCNEVDSGPDTCSRPLCKAVRELQQRVLVLEYPGGEYDS
jgi:hypothetical protein